MPLRKLLTVSILAGAIATLAGCGHRAPLDPASETTLAPSPSSDSDSRSNSSRRFYPLDLGNRWAFSGTFTIRSGRPGEPLETIFSADRTVDVELTCVERLDGRDYVVERSASHEDEGTFLTWVRYRQDGAGLYEADLDVSTPPGCDEGTASGLAARRGAAASEALMKIAEPGRREAVEAAWVRLRTRLARLDAGPGRLLAHGARRGGPQPGELTRLRYPLRRGQRWIVRSDPEFKVWSWVEGLKRLRTPAGRIDAYSVRIANSLFGPEDRAVLYFSERGFAGLRVHLVDRGTDAEGNEVITAFDEVLRLEDLDLVGRRRH